jgi:hypothetical protein
MLGLPLVYEEHNHNTSYLVPTVTARFYVTCAEVSRGLGGVAESQADSELRQATKVDRPVSDHSKPAVTLKDMQPLLQLKLPTFLLASLQVRQDVFLKHRHRLELLHLHFVQCELHQPEKSA